MVLGRQYQRSAPLESAPRLPHGRPVRPRSPPRLPTPPAFSPTRFWCGARTTATEIPVPGSQAGDGEYCYPLTVADLHARYLLACQGWRSTQTLAVHTHFERLFREFGLPRAIRTDDGVTGLHGLSTLSVWWNTTSGRTKA